MDRTLEVPKFYGSLAGMQRKFDKYSRQDAFQGDTVAEFTAWQQQARETLKDLLGWKYMEDCPLNPVVEERIIRKDGIVREKVIIQVEPDTYMPMYILIPAKYADAEQGVRNAQNGANVQSDNNEGNTAKADGANRKPHCFIAFPGHMGAGKYSIAGCDDIEAVRKAIERFNYDYGVQLARRGIVAICPDCRGFGERRDEALQSATEKNFLNSTCFHLSHMAEALGETVAGMCAWDASRLIDYVYERGEWNTDTLGVVGFSGGGMQTLYGAAIDERVKQVIISGYFYGFKDSLLLLNGNCNCNYVPHLWEHFDIGDLGAMIAPRPLAIQSCKGDHLNGPRGLDNVTEQIDITRKGYQLHKREEYLYHDVREGEHCWHEEVLDIALPLFREGF